MLMRKLIVLPLIILLVLSACSVQTAIPNETEIPSAKTQTAAPPPIQPEDAISDNIGIKMQAVSNQDLELYLTTISQENEYYYNEQQRWFYEIINDSITSFSLELIDVEIIDEHTAIATINEKHYHFEQFDFDYKLLYKLIDGTWLDCDYPFEVKEYEGFILKYQPEETRAIQFAEIIQKSLKSLAEEFDMSADSNIEVKLYFDRELLRQRTVPTVRRLFTGWGEADESIKFYSGFEDTERYYPLLMHEFTHHITLKMCNNNIASWFAEGIAVSYGTYPAEGGTRIDKGTITKDDVAVTLEWLSGFDNGAATDEAQIISFYHGAGMFVEFLRDTYGQQSIIDILYKAGEKPYNKSILNDEFYIQNQKTLINAFDAVLGKSLSMLSDEYLEWLEEY